MGCLRVINTVDLVPIAVGPTNTNRYRIDVPFEERPVGITVSAPFRQVRSLQVWMTEKDNASHWIPFGFP
jgi:hypothetical protein